MDGVETEVIESGHRESEISQRVPAAVAAPHYRRPRIVTIGTATELVQQNSTGAQSDGSGGWYVWGS
jgi:hypothetical protein